jgi:hypothetical protein
MDHEARWQQIENDRRFGMPALHDPTCMAPSVSSGLRVRREYAARDGINSRAWDFFHATPPTQTASEDLAKRGAPVYMDMNPIPSRNATAQYRNQPEYMPDPPRPTTTAKDLGIPPPSGPIPKPADNFSGNYYTQRLDAGGFDSRNMIRELQGAVSEDNRDRDTDASRLLNQRQFYDRWLPPRAAVDASSLQAYELLRPKTDDWKVNTREHT